MSDIIPAPPTDVSQNGFKRKIEEIQKHLLKAQSGSQADLLKEALGEPADQLRGALRG